MIFFFVFDEVMKMNYIHAQYKPITISMNPQYKRSLHDHRYSHNTSIVTHNTSIVTHNTSIVTHITQ